MRGAIVLGLALLAAGCTIRPIAPPPTASGQPEHTVSNIDVACFRGQLMSHVVNSGFTIRTSNDTQIVAGRITQNFGAAVLYGTRAFGAPEERILLTMIPIAENSLRVILQGGYVSNPGTGFESMTPIAGTASDTTGLAAQLDSFASACPGKRAPINEPMAPGKRVAGKTAPAAPGPSAQEQEAIWLRWAEHHTVCRKAWAPDNDKIVQCAGPEPKRGL
jgi:hypothetical protein